jgi:hypothetical protein
VGAIVQVVNSLGTTFFVSDNGYYIYPTSASLANVESTYSFKPASTQMAYILYNYDEAAANSAASTKVLNIELTYAASVDGTVEEAEEQGAVNDSVSTAAIIELNNVVSSSSSSKFSIVNNYFLLTGVNYFFYANIHYFTLVKYEDEPVEDGVLKLYLRHSGTAESNTVTTTSYQAFNSGYPVYFKAFYIGDFLEPDVKSIEIHADVNEYSSSLEYANEKVYTLTL